MAFSIDTFKADGLTRGGARPTLFEVEIPGPWPGGLSPARKVTLLAKAASLPPSIIDPIEIGYMGRRIKIAGDRSFPPWSITLMNDEDFDVRRAFEAWHESINSREPNLMEFPSTSPENYKLDIHVTQMSKSGPNLGTESIYTYTLVGAFPVVVDPIQLDWEAVNQIEQFNVEFHYDYWQPFRVERGIVN